MRTDNAVRLIFCLQAVKHRQHKQGKHILTAAATGFAAGKLVEHIIKVRHKVEHFQIDFLCEPMPKGRRTSHKIYSGDFGPRLLPHEFLGHRLSCLNMTGANGCCQY